MTSDEAFKAALDKGAMAGMNPPSRPVLRWHGGKGSTKRKAAIERALTMQFPDKQREQGRA